MMTKVFFRTAAGPDIGRDGHKTFAVDPPDGRVALRFGYFDDLAERDWDTGR